MHHRPHMCFPNRALRTNIESKSFKKTSNTDSQRPHGRIYSKMKPSKSRPILVQVLLCQSIGASNPSIFMFAILEVWLPLTFILKWTFFLIILRHSTLFHFLISVILRKLKESASGLHQLNPENQGQVIQISSEQTLGIYFCAQNQSNERVLLRVCNKCVSYVNVNWKNWIMRANADNYMCIRFRHGSDVPCVNLMSISSIQFNSLCFT